MDAMTQALRMLKSLSSDLRKSKTAFDDLIHQGVLDTHEAQDYLEGLNTEEPEVAQQVAEVLKRQKSASVGFGKASSNPSSSLRGRSSSVDKYAAADDDLLNMDFGGY